MLAARQRRKQAVTRLAALIAVFAALVAVAGRSKSLDDIENRTWDWRLRAVARPDLADPAIKIILVDQSSIEHFSKQEAVTWPWYRGMYGAVVQFLRDAGARAVAFDILYTEPSSFGVDDDQAFAEAMKGSLPIVLAGALRQQRLANSDGAAFKEFQVFQESSGAKRVLDEAGIPAGALPKFAGVELPLLEYWPSLTQIGNVSASPDSDGVYRHVRVGGVVNDVAMLGLPFSLYRAAFPEGQAWKTLRRFIDPQGRLALRFKGPARTFQTFGIDSIILSQRQREEGKAPFVPLSRFKDSIVLVGMDAPGLLDLRPTPLSQIFPGVEYNATILDNLMHQEFVRKAGNYWNWALAVLAVAVCAGAILLGASQLIQTLAIASVLTGLIGGGFAAAHAGLWINLALPVLATLLAVAVALALQYQAEGRERRFLRSAFQQYVSGDVIEELLAQPDALTLGGERKELTMFFSDIAQFTAISERLAPEQLGRLLNNFLSEMSAIILKHGGTLDKYVGDAIVAFWNAPIAIADHPERAVRAALECQGRILERSPDWEREFGVQLRMRIGIHTGEVSVGNFGSDSRFNYTVLGDAANTASRLEGANKKFGSSILVSAATAGRLQDKQLKLRRVGVLRLVGKSQDVEVFEPFSAAARPNLDQAIRAFESGNLSQALELFESFADDHLAAAYIARIRAAGAAALPGSWNSVWELTDK